LDGGATEDKEEAESFNINPGKLFKREANILMIL